MNKTMKIIIISMFILLITGITYASYFVFDSKNDDAGTTENDIWSFDVSQIDVQDSDSIGYVNKYRGKLRGNIGSTLFGRFTIGTGIELLDFGRTDCGNNQKTYSLSGSIQSVYFGDMNITSDSFFCPSREIGKNLNLTLESSQLGRKKVATAILSETIQGNTPIFEKKQVAILGMANLLGNVGSLLSESGNREINTFGVGVSKRDLWGNIDRNIDTLFRNIKPETVNTELGNLNSGTKLAGGKYLYYDYSNTSYSGLINGAYGNKGKILTIQNSPLFQTGALENYTLENDGYNTIIVKGGNIYINADLYNKDTSSLLTIVAKRDTQNNKNGGNIYINPNVTNIDAVLIAEGSILSFNGGRIMNRTKKSDKADLARQLYMYGSIFSANVIGTEKVPYNSDKYIEDRQDFNSDSLNIYDLANLRSFQVRLPIDNPSVSVCGGPDKSFLTAGYASNSSIGSLDVVQEYAWAGKMKCFNRKINTNIPTTPNYKDVTTPVAGLRTIGRQESIVIEYNPTIQLKPPYILRKN